MRGLASIVVLCTAVCAVPSARAQSSLAADGRERVAAAELSEMLTREARRAYEWRALWTAINAAVAVGSMAGIAILPDSERPASIVGSIAAGLSAAAAWGWPLEVESAAESAALLANLPAKERLARLHALYERAAADEIDRQHGSWHVLNYALSLIPGAIIWLGYHQPVDAMLTALSGFALGELAILTQPTGLAVRRRPALALSVSVSRQGLSLSYALAW